LHLFLSRLGSDRPGARRDRRRRPDRRRRQRSPGLVAGGRHGAGGSRRPLSRTAAQAALRGAGDCRSVPCRQWRHPTARRARAAAHPFLPATPIIGAAGLLEVPPFVPSPDTKLPIAVVGGLLAGIAAYLSVRFLMRYFENSRLDPFGYYCLVAGLASLAYLTN